MTFFIFSVCKQFVRIIVTLRNLRFFCESLRRIYSCKLFPLENACYPATGHFMGTAELITKVKIKM